MIHYMERSTRYGCHFINQPLSSFILGIDPPDLLTHARWWIQQTSSVGRRDFSSQTLGLLQVLFLHRTGPEAYNLLLLSCLFNIFKRLIGLFLCGSAPCAISTPDTSI